MFRPISWIAATFAIGIAAARFGAFTVYAWLLAGLVSAVGAVVCYRLRLPSAVPLLCAVACAGAVVYLRDVHPPPQDPLREAERQHVTLVGIVVAPPQVRADRTRLVVAVERIRIRRDAVHRARGRVLVVIRGRPEVRYGDRIGVSGRVFAPPAAGNPGEFSYREHLAVQGISAGLYPGRRDAVRIIGRGRGNPLLSAVFLVRERTIAFYRSALPGARGALLSSLLLGDDGAITEEMRTAFARAGLLHVLVVSGSQVGLVMATMLWLARLLRAPPRLAAAIAGIGVVIFALMAGWVPSVGRAALMAVTAAIALAWGRAYDVYAALAAAATVLLASTPRLLFNAGFQLSFVATWALIYLAPVIHKRLVVLPRWLGTLASMTTAAQVAVMPVLAYHFLQVSLTGLAGNLVVVPIVAVLVPVGFAVALLGLISPTIGALAAWPLRPLLDAVSFLTRVFAAAPGAAVSVPPPSLPVIVGFYVFLVLAVEWLRGRLRLRRHTVLAVAVGVVAVLLWTRVLAAAVPHRLTMTFLDVGQGDAILVRGPSGQTLLIDGGGEVEGHLTGFDVGAQRVVPALRRLGVVRLDVVILSHAHEDHVGGLVAVLQNFSVGVALDGGFAHPAPSYAGFLHLIEARRIPYRLARRGMRLDLGDGVQLAVLLPEEPLISGSGSDVNLNSVVLRLTFGQVSALLTGDMEALNEAQLLAWGDDLRGTILKVAHHGSDTGTTPAFVDAVRPAVAVISVGALNPFRHPRPVTLQTLEEAGVQVYRTDRDGAVTIETDGRRLLVRTGRDAGDR